MTAEEFISQMTTSTFWDVDFSQIDLVKNSQFIISRIFMRGDLPEIHDVLKYYGKEKTIGALKNAQYLDDLTLSYCSTIFQIPKSDFKCYTEKQLIPNYLGY
ncbi:MAG: DUF6922 domain-containing protein [Bacteroidia bacterium]